MLGGMKELAPGDRIFSERRSNTSLSWMIARLGWACRAASEFRHWIGDIATTFYRHCYKAPHLSRREPQKCLPTCSLFLAHLVITGPIIWAQYSDTCHILGLWEGCLYHIWNCLSGQRPLSPVPPLKLVAQCIYYQRAFRFYAQASSGFYLSRTSTTNFKYVFPIPRSSRENCTGLTTWYSSQYHFSNPLVRRSQCLTPSTRPSDTARCCSQDTKGDPHSRNCCFSANNSRFPHTVL